MNKSERAEGKDIATPKREVITQDAMSVSFMGVRLLKAQNREGIRVPSEKDFTEFIIDPVSLGLLRDSATAFALSEPVFHEAGTSVGKSKHLEYMCARLGWEHIYININPGTTEKTTMGKLIPNKKRKSKNDPEYHFWLGPVSEALTPEEGKIKLLVLDEIGNGDPACLIALHEILDALGKKESYADLRPWGGEIVKLDPSKTKIAACANPPGGRYQGKHIIDPALMRRFIYIKGPEQLPDGIFNSRTDILFGFPGEKIQTPNHDFFISRDVPLTREELPNIPGIKPLLEGYKEFHNYICKMLHIKHDIATNQPQPIELNTLDQPRRVRDFIRLFYQGDIEHTLKQAIRYFYINKIENNFEKLTLEGEMNKALSRANPESTRIGLSEPIDVYNQKQPNTAAGHHGNGSDPDAQTPPTDWSQLIEEAHVA